MKTRKFESKADWTCPVHGIEVSHKIRTRLDDHGKYKYAGDYYGCPSYSECGYYITPSGRVKVIEDSEIASILSSLNKE